MSTAVLDASAVLAVYFDEPGKESVNALMAGSIVSAVNYTEIVSKALEEGSSPGQAWRGLFTMDFVVVPHDAALARRAGELRLLTRQAGLSLGDRACLALAERERLPVLTTDRAWAGLDLDIDIRVIR